MNKLPCVWFYIWIKQCVWRYLYFLLVKLSSSERKNLQVAKIKTQQKMRSIITGNIKTTAWVVVNLSVERQGSLKTRLLKQNKTIQNTAFTNVFSKWCLCSMRQN